MTKHRWWHVFCSDGRSIETRELFQHKGFLYFEYWERCNKCNQIVSPVQLDKIPYYPPTE